MMCGSYSPPYSGTAKKEEAADLFIRAANAYKVGKRYKGKRESYLKFVSQYSAPSPSAAGEAFRRAAEIHVELDVKHEAASTLVEAGQVLKKDDALGKYTVMSALMSMLIALPV